MFETKGYSTEYYSNGKYIGSLPLDNPNGREMGYNGRQYLKLTEDLILNKSNKKVKIKSGTEVYTEIIVLCGRMN